MTFRQLVAAAALLLPLAATAAELPLHRDLNTIKVNAQTRRTELIFFSSEQDALTKPFEQSPFYLSLNGTWDFKYAADESELPGEWSTIKVPGNWEFQGWGTPVYVNHPYDFAPENPQPPLLPDRIPVGVYRRSFTVPEAWKGRAIYLNLCGAKSGVYVYVNGTEIGYNEDSKDLARYPLNEYLKEGDNELQIKCFRYSTGSYLECQDFWRVSGIERDVYLSSEAIADNIDLHVVSTLDETCTDGIFSLAVDSWQTPYYKLLDKDGSVVAEGLANVQKLRIPNVRKWSAETPELYALLLKTGDEYTRFDVGFRRTEIKGNTFYFNGKPIKLKGVNMHEHHELTGHYVTREYVLANLRRMRELNINAIRTCHYPQPRFFYELCDSLGFYVYDEANIESHGMGYGEKSLAKDPDWGDKHYERTLNMYTRTANYPCVNILSLGNEAGDGVNFTRTYNVLKKLEKDGQNRPVVYERAEGGSNTDFLNPMYPGTRWLVYQGDRPSDKPVVLCEYAHAMGNSTGSFDLMWDKAFYRYDNLQGGFIWDWMDQGIVEKTPDGRRYWTYGGDYGDPETDPKGWWADRNFNCNGIVNPDLDIHPGALEVKYWYQEAAIRFADESDTLVQNSFNIFNRQYFKALDHELQWELTEDGKVVKSGSLHVDNAPQTGRDFSVDLPELDKDKTYYIGFRLVTTEESGLLPAGYAAATEQLLLRHADPKPVKPVQYRASVKEKGGKIVLKGKGGKLVFNSATGTVEQYKLRCRNVFRKDFGLKPEFWRAPNDNEWGSWGPRVRYAAWKDSLSVLSVETDSDEFGAAVRVKYGLPDGCTMDVAYNLIAGGALRIDAAFHGGADPAKRIDVPRIGFRTRMPSRCDRFRYFGRGPQENYCDRFSAYWTGLYESSAKDECYPYVRPQETGHHTGVEWLEIGPVRVSSPGSFEFNALRCSIEDLDPREADGGRRWEHVTDVPVQPYVELCLDGFMTGVGGYDSWGSRPEPERTIWAHKDYSFSLTLSRR